VLDFFDSIQILISDIRCRRVDHNVKNCTACRGINTDSRTPGPLPLTCRPYVSVCHLVVRNLCFANRLPCVSCISTSVVFS